MFAQSMSGHAAPADMKEKGLMQALEVENAEDAVSAKESSCALS